MAFYTRTTDPRSIPPPSREWMPEKLYDDDDFIQDPDQIRDQLPQPFRMIDKVLQNLIDDAWEFIFNRENHRLKEASKIKPPQFECTIELQGCGKAGCLAVTDDGRCIIAGLPDGLAAFDAITQQKLAVWTEDTVEVLQLHVSNLQELIYLIDTVDDMGIARQFALAEDEFYLLGIVNDQESEKKSLANKCESSSFGDYLGVSLESPASQETWLDIYKLPKETWLKELESLVVKSPKRDSTERSTSPKTDDAPIEYSHSTEGAASVTQVENDNEVSAVPSSSSVSGKHAHRFAPSTLVMRIKPPAPLNGVTVNSPYQLSKTVDHVGEVVGLGQTHLLSSSHLEQREALFEQTHESHIKYLPKAEASVKVLMNPTFHFLTSGEAIAQNPDQSDSAETPVSVCVWWTGSTNLLQYLLNKTAKDLEHKADVVWPVSTAIVASAISSCSSLLALALSNNNLIIWDRGQGLPRKVLHVTEVGRILKVTFLDPAICPQGDGFYHPYSSHTNCYVMIYCTEGQLFMVNAGRDTDDVVQDISLNIEKPDDHPALVQSIPGLPHLLITARETGQLFIHDILEGGHILCELTVANDYELWQPWDPVVAVGGQGQVIYLRASAKEKECNGEVLVGIQLSEVTALDRHRIQQWQTVPFTVPCTTQNRISALMKARLARQPLRQSLMQNRWGQLQKELAVIQHIRESRKTRPASVTAV